MNKEEIIKVINNINPKNLKNISNFYQKGKYKVYNFFHEISDDEIVMVYCIIDNNDNFVIRPTYFFTTKDNKNNEIFGAELVGNDLAIIAVNNNKENYLVDLSKNNYVNGVFDKKNVLLRFVGYILAENNLIICITEDECLVYDIKNRKIIYKFDSIDLYENHIICYYINHQIKVALKFNYELELIDETPETIIYNKIIYPVIPKNILSDKNKVIEYVGSCLNTEYSRNYIEEYYLNESRRYMQ